MCHPRPPQRFPEARIFSVTRPRGQVSPGAEAAGGQFYCGQFYCGRFYCGRRRANACSTLPSRLSITVCWSSTSASESPRKKNPSEASERS